MPHWRVEQGSTQWHDLHLGRITASRAAACLRIKGSGKRGALGAYNEIMGITHQMANEFMQFGMRNEETARRDYYDFGKAQKPPLFRVLHPGDFWTHPEHDCLGASPDLILDDDGCGDIKCPKIKLPEAIPADHEVQLRIQMACCERQWADYYAWMGNRNYYYERIYRDLAIEADLIRDLKDFYEQYVRTGNPPPRRSKKAAAPPCETLPPEEK